MEKSKIFLIARNVLTYLADLSIYIPLKNLNAYRTNVKTQLLYRVVEPLGLFPLKVLKLRPYWRYKTGLTLRAASHGATLKLHQSCTHNINAD